MIAAVIAIGVLIICAIGLLTGILIGNWGDVRALKGVPRIKFEEFKEASKWVEFFEHWAYVDYMECGLWEKFSFGYWDLLKYKAWRVKKGWEEAKVIDDRRKKREQAQLENLRRIIENKKTIGRG